MFPVTNTCWYAIPSRTRFSSAIEVGARWNAAIRAISWRFSSSGNGVSVSPVRIPASTCPTGIRRWNDASAAASADDVSPWTSAAAGNPSSRMSVSVATDAPVAPKRSRQKVSRLSITSPTRSLSVSPGRPTRRS